MLSPTGKLFSCGNKFFVQLAPICRFEKALALFSSWARFRRRGGIVTVFGTKVVEVDFCRAGRNYTCVQGRDASEREIVLGIRDEKDVMDVFSPAHASFFFKVTELCSRMRTAKGECLTR